MTADLDHFERVFRASADPWNTHTRRAEAIKRDAILRCLGPKPLGRVLELGCGNGSNTVALAQRALHVDACDGARAALSRAAKWVAQIPHIHLHHLMLPQSFPRETYDAVVVAEMLYYLPQPVLERVMEDIARALRPGGRLVLCHHHRQFHDAAQRQDTLHQRALRVGAAPWRAVMTQRTAQWEALAVKLGRKRA